MYVGPGIYQHYKGGHYFVLGLARNHDTGQEMVIYRPLSLTKYSHMMVRQRATFDERVDKPITEFSRWRFERIAE